MSKYQRILTEVFAPPFLAAVWIIISSPWVEPGTPLQFSTFVGSSLMLVFFSYMFGMIPAMLYTVAMELWYRGGLNSRCGLFCTAGLSAFLGAVAGSLSAGIGTWIGMLIPLDCLHFALVGAVIGLLVGLIVGRDRASDLINNAI